MADAGTMQRTLVIDTATAACSVALIEGGAVIAHHHDLVGRGHAEQLIPMIARLPGGGRADHILVDCGPGSFTGVRVGIAAARGLGLGWGVPIAGYSSAALIAAAATRDSRAGLAVAIEAGHGEVFVQCFDADAMATSELVSLTPAMAVEVIGGRPVFGSGVARLASLLPIAAMTHRLPDAREAIHLSSGAASLPARPIYGRAPDAKLPGAAPAARAAA